MLKEMAFPAKHWRVFNVTALDAKMVSLRTLISTFFSSVTKKVCRIESQMKLKNVTNEDKVHCDLLKLTK